jgi:hypothetical protein
MGIQTWETFTHGSGSYLDIFVAHEKLFLFYILLYNSKVLKVDFLSDFLLCTNWNWSILFYICKEKKYLFSDLQ